MCGGHTVPFRLIRLSRVTRASDETKFLPCNASQALTTNQKFGRPCHASHTGLPVSHNPAVSADDEVNKDENFPRVRVTAADDEPKIWSAMSRVTGADESIEMVQYSL